MDSGTNNKKTKKVEIFVDSDDNVPLGSIFKRRKARGAKKVSLASDLEGMNDTLASFRKKLKGTKRDRGSRASRGKVSTSNVAVESSHGSLNVSCQNEGLDEKISLNKDSVNEGRGGGDSGSDMDMKTMGSCQLQVDGRVVDLALKGVEDHDVSDGGLVAHGSRNTPKDEKGAGGLLNAGLQHSSAETGDSLSEILLTAQSNFVRKSCKTVSSEQTRGSQNVNNDELSLDCKSFRKTVEDISDSTIPDDGPLAETCFPDNIRYGDSQQLSCVRSENIGSPSDQKDGIQERIHNDGLNKCSAILHEVEEIIDPARLSKIGKGVSPIIEGELKNRLIDDQAEMCHVTSKCSYFTSLDKEKLSPRDSEPLTKLSENVQSENICQTSEIVFQGSSRNEAMTFSGRQLELDGVYSDSKFDLGRSCSYQNNLDTKDEAQDFVSGNLLENNYAVSRGCLYSTVFDEKNKSELAVQPNHLDIPSETHNVPKNSVAYIRKCSLELDPTQPSKNTFEKASLAQGDCLYAKRETEGSSPQSTIPDENENSAEYAASVSEVAYFDDKTSAVMRRRAKKRRQGDMAYEGDADWEVLINDQAFLESQCVVEGESIQKTRGKLDSSLNVVEVFESDAVAVSAGLKAHEAGPVEKIRFKEILKRKGGLQEYLNCRNRILALWGCDITRILPLADCGVRDTPSENEPPHSSLIREVYAFLDQCGYINVGIASLKDNVGNSARHNYTLVGEKGYEESCAVSVADSEDGVSFIVGQTKKSNASVEIKNSLIEGNNEDLTIEGTEDMKNVNVVTTDISNMTLHEERKSDDCQEKLGIQEEFSGIIHGNANSSEQNNKPTCVKSVLGDQIGDILNSDSNVRKSVIVIGGGPAGLTAARHLQRLGFPVTVLEARSRIGGRVFTDRSSLSVPVDLGASIITGVEADVATERRPDPSALVCAQLGLELTVLNSECPLYDIVTGQKVSVDMDEALEAEFNSLLDDMVLLVAQKGDQAMRMSLEDGLEYALKKRRLEHSRRSNEQNNYTDGPLGSKRGVIYGKEMEEVLSPPERRVMDWHFANLEYGCAALLKEVSLPYWNQDDLYGGYGGAHCMIKGGYSTVVESLGEGLVIHLNHAVTNVSYGESGLGNKVKVSTSNGNEFFGDVVLVTVPLGCLKAETIKFSPPLPQWKYSSIQRLGFGVLNKVVLEFPSVFWDDSVDYFGATAEETSRRGQCFMFWNIRKTVGAPVLIALVVGKAAIDGQNLNSSDHVNHALKVLRKLFGEASVPDPVASVVTDWGRDPFSYGAYSYVAIGASGEDYDILGRPVDNCLFFAGEATCKEHPDTVGGAMMSGLREAVRIIDLFSSGIDYTAEVEAVEAAQKQSETERDEVRDIIQRLDAAELSNILYKKSLDGARILSREALLRDLFLNAKTNAGRLHVAKQLLRDLFLNAKTNAGRLHVAKQLLSLPVENLKSFAGSKKGLSILNSWILDSMGKDGTQLLRHCVRLLVLVSTDLLAVRLSGIGKTVKEKVCVHTSRDIRAIASQLVSVWLEVFRKKKTCNGGRKLSRQANAIDISKRKGIKDPASGKPPLSTHHSTFENKGRILTPAMSSASIAHVKKSHGNQGSQQVTNDLWHDVSSSKSQGSIGEIDTAMKDTHCAMSEEEKAAIAAAEAARAKALAAAEAYSSAEVRNNMQLQLPKIPSFDKFKRREQYTQKDESDGRKKWSGGVLGRQDCISEIDSRNCRVRDWSVDFSACVNLDSSRISADNLSQRSHSNEIASHLNFREHSGENVAVDSSLYTKAWIDSADGEGIKDYHAIERWQSQAAAAGSDFSNPSIHLKDEEDSNACSRLPSWKDDGVANDSTVSQVTVNKENSKSHSRGADRIKQAVADYVASLLMPLYKARKLDKDAYKAIMKKSTAKVIEKSTDADKAMSVHEFLDFKRKNKIRPFVDKLIERHMEMKPDVKS